MTYAKVSVSLEDADIALLDAEVREGRFATRSAALQEAVRMLRESRLADAYAEAYGEWADAGDEHAWGAASDDGVA